ncbi:MAG TPA: hypothetical protein VKE96_00175 [Vicinamibacterales bacterium]|nr:hypothetical protein [Vicinamibacterales bacterium]
MSGRLPSLTPADLDEAQHTLYDSLAANEIPWAESAGVQARTLDGPLLGPFNPLLFSPVLATAQLGLLRAEKIGTSLSRRVHEIVVLTVGSEWQAEYELYAHSALGKIAGLSDVVIRALASSQLPAFDSEEDARAHAFARQLAHNHRVDEETYERALQTFGSKGVVDIVMLVGLYVTVCAIINAFEIPSPRTVAG